MERTSPLLAIRYDIPFGEIAASDVEPAALAGLAEARRALAEIVAPGARSWERTLGPLDRLTERLDFVMNVVSHLESVATTPELRAAYNAVLPEVASFESQLSHSAELWAAVSEYAGSEEARRLDGARRRFVEKTLADLRREGAHLEAGRKERLEALNRELAITTTRFSENVLDETAAFELYVEQPERTSGLPPAVVTAARAAAEARGRAGWRFTLHEPVLVPVLTYADDATLRRELYLAHNARATAGARDNRPLLSRILELRREKAALLGYPTFADYVLEDRMAKTAATARRFLEELAERTRPFFERERAELEAFRRELEGSDAPPLEPWDVPYYAEKLRRRRFDFDEESLRPYFPLESVLEGLFHIAHRLFGVEVTEARPPERPPTWHPEVRYFRIRDDDGRLLGSFYADFFPRETKRGGAWMGDLLTGGPRDHGFDPHLGVICANVTPPLGDRPPLLTHHEVETLFHEFGHLLHHCLSEVDVRSLAGTHVAWDFVELPSQILENWCWERESLDLFARHWQTGETIPEELLRRMIAARNFRSATAMMRQLGFATLDLRLHTEYDPTRDGDVLSYARRIQQAFAPTPLRDDYAMVASFTHLFGDPVGYGAGYYSYKWAEVLDADAFSRFQREGILNRETGRAFRRDILARGDSEDPLELFRRFMGRDPDVGALLRRSGLVE